MTGQQRLAETAALIEECYNAYAEVTTKFIGRLCMAELIGVIECHKFDVMNNSNYAPVEEVSH